MPEIYLLHFDKPLGNPDTHKAQHYLGYSKTSAKARFKKHLAGEGAAITRACVERGITFECVRIWKTNDRQLERLLKAYKKHWKFCPHCNPNYQRIGVRPGIRNKIVHGES